MEGRSARHEGSGDDLHLGNCSAVCLVMHRFEFVVEFAIEEVFEVRFSQPRAPGVIAGGPCARCSGASTVPERRGLPPVRALSCAWAVRQVRHHLVVVPRAISI